MREREADGNADRAARTHFEIRTQIAGRPFARLRRDGAERAAERVAQRNERPRDAFERRAFDMRQWVALGTLAFTERGGDEAPRIARTHDDEAVAEPAAHAVDRSAVDEQTPFLGTRHRGLDQLYVQLRREQAREFFAHAVRDETGGGQRQGRAFDERRAPERRRQAVLLRRFERQRSDHFTKSSAVFSRLPRTWCADRNASYAT